ncbi:MAG TPA: TonB-dependent receptor, partial [Flavisolibacter sp.]|nr:TonB-dependent receptor [Flavisolibacter sp.]
GYYEQYKADEEYEDYNLALPPGGETSSDLVRQLWLDNYYYGNIYSLQYEKEGTAFTLGGAITNYDGAHYGKVIWAKNGLSENKRWYDLDSKKSDANVYAKWQQKLGSYWQLYTDLQWRGITYDTEGFRDNPTLGVKQFYNFLNPKAGISYVRNKWMLYTSYGIANKEPNRDDFEAGAEQLPVPERLHDVELGVEQKQKNYNWGATLYYMRYNNQLVLTGKINDVGAYTRSNIKNSYRAGIELQGATQFTSWLHAAVNLTFSKNKLKNFEEFIDDYDAWTQKSNLYKETTISFSPSVIGSSTLSFLYNGLELQIIGKYVGKQYLDNTENEGRKLSPYYTQDVRAIYTFRNKWLKGTNIIAQINNLFDTLYEPNGYTFSYYSGNKLTTENYYFPMAGVNWTVGLNIKL